jgi:hypothetical protein
VVLGARGRHACWLGEDVRELIEEGAEQVVEVADRQEGAGRPSDALPADESPSVPERHLQGAEIPQDWPEGREPSGAEDDVVAGERKGVEIGGEVLALDDERSVAVDPGASHAFPVGDRDAHPPTRS